MKVWVSVSVGRPHLYSGQNKSNGDVFFSSLKQTKHFLSQWIFHTLFIHIILLFPVNILYGVIKCAFFRKIVIAQFPFLWILIKRSVFSSVSLGTFFFLSNLDIRFGSYSFFMTFLFLFMTFLFPFYDIPFSFYNILFYFYNFYFSLFLMDLSV